MKRRASWMPSSVPAGSRRSLGRRPEIETSPESTSGRAAERNHAGEADRRMRGPVEDRAADRPGLRHQRERRRARRSVPREGRVQADVAAHDAEAVRADDAHRRPGARPQALCACSARPASPVSAKASSKPPRRLDAGTAPASSAMRGTGARRRVAITARSGGAGRSREARVGAPVEHCAAMLQGSRHRARRRAVARRRRGCE